jgi:excisionase family DNA binding protein
MTVREAATQLGIGESTVYALCKARKLSHKRIGARGRGKIVIEPADIEAFNAACRVEMAGAGERLESTMPARASRPVIPDRLAQLRAARRAAPSGRRP